MKGGAVKIYCLKGVYMKAVVGLFRSSSEAQRAVEALTNAGFSRNNISLIARDDTASTDYRTTQVTDTTSVGAGAGALSGTVLGGLAGLLVGLGAIVIPGIGPVIAAGTLASTLGATAAGAGIGAGIGAITGGLVGALADVGIPEEEAHFYAEGVKRGGILVILQTDDTQISMASSIMRQHDAVEVNTEREAWQASGWRRFDETTNPTLDYPRLSD
jgi:uncharacterized membrane protein